ncbi:hypothetical protein ACNJHR_20960, partial [Mycobacterium tuberculosis]
HLDEFGVRQTTIAQPFDDGSGTTARDASPTGPSPSLNTKRSAEGRDGRRSTRATDSLLLLVLVLDVFLVLLSSLKRRCIGQTIDEPGQIVEERPVSVDL